MISENLSKLGNTNLFLFLLLLEWVLQLNMLLLMVNQPTWYMELKLALNVSLEH